MVDERTCCGCLHVKTATWIIAIVHIIIAISNVITAVATVSNHKVQTENWWASVIMAVLCIIWLLVVILLMVGLWQNNASYVLPHLLSTVVMAIMFAVRAGQTLLNDGNMNEKWGNVIVTGISILILVLLLWIEYRCYQYLQAFPG